jgi:hypothetical protein
MTACPNARRHGLVAAVAAALATNASGVSLSPTGEGQALIFPYYTVRSSEGGNAFNTYLSIVSTTTLAKSVRVRIREGRAARPVLDFNLFLGPNDVWTAAAIPIEDANDAHAGGTRLVTRDTSCTDPPFETTDGVGSISFSASSYSAGNGDGFGTGLDRTREGFIEVIEMATLSGQAALAVSHTSVGVPRNCGYIQANPVIPASMLTPPSGALSGSGTLINVANGRDFAVPAAALADLASRPFHRHYTDPYPDFFAREIDPVSTVSANGQVYRSRWEYSVDAVSAVFMRSEWVAEYVLDDATGSLTDLVATLPTHHFYADSSRFTPPFNSPFRWEPTCGLVNSAAVGERLNATYFSRDQQGQVVGGCGTTPCAPDATPGPRICAAAGVASLRNAAAHMPGEAGRTAVLGSTTRGFLLGGVMDVAPGYQNGWIHIHAPGDVELQAPLLSLPSSTRVDLASGQVVSGAHAFRGLPVIGFSARTFSNGTLSCAGAGSCQGNYGGAFAFKYRRSIFPP